MVLTLALNVALLVALSVAYGWVVRRWREWTPPHQIVSGLLFGGIAVVGMMTPFRPAPGVQYDGRSIIIAVAGIFGGPAVAAIAAVVAAAYRLWLGGAGAWVGVSVVAEAAALGVAYHYLARRLPGVSHWLPLYGLALTVHALMLALQLALPEGIGPGIVEQIWFPVLALYPIGMLLVCRLMLDQEQHLRDEAALRRLNESLERVVEDRTEELRTANAQLRTASDELRMTNESLVEANAAKSQFLSAMSHELRTPLNSIIGFSSLLAGGHVGQVNDEQARQLDMISRSGKRLLAIISGILDLSRIDAHVLSLSFERVDARALAREAADALMPEAMSKGLTVDLDLPDEPVSLSSDPLKVGQILLNLGGNAIKFTESGTITIRVRHLGHAGIAFDVADTGPGIPDDFREDLFTEFAQHDVRMEGTGLGLAISLRLAELLGGTIKVETRAGEGSTFSLVLPAAGGTWTT